MTHCKLIMVSLLFLSSSIYAKDLGINYGEPTPALAMYAAQTKFAVDRCVSDGLINDVNGAEKFLKYFDRGVWTSTYKDMDEEFSTNYDLFLSNYTAAWNIASTENRQQFCDSLNSEILIKKEKFSWLKTTRWLETILYFREKFSPLSKTSIERQRKMQNIAAIASFAASAATTAASISASHDAVSSAKAGDWSASNQQMDMSQKFNKTGMEIALNTPSSTIINAQTISVLEVKMEDGTQKVIRCPVIDHFFGFSAPVESQIWITYQKVWVPCRNPLPSDMRPAE